MNTNQQFSVSVHILTILAASEAQAITSEAIAGSVGTNPVVIRRILGALRKHGLVDSRSGTAGGWRLKQAADQIPLCEVYRAIRHEDVLAIHQHPNLDCPVGGKIQPALDEVFHAAQSALELALGQYTVADLREKVLGKSIHEEVNDE